MSTETGLIVVLGPAALTGVIGAIVWWKRGSRVAPPDAEVKGDRASVRERAD